MTGQMMYPPDDDWQHDDDRSRADWRQEMVNRGFSPNAIDAFELLMSPEIETSQDVLILYFSRSVPLFEIAELESTLNELYYQEFERHIEIEEELPDKVIRIRTITYQNPVLLIFGFAVASVAAALMVREVYNHIREKPEPKAVSGSYTDDDFRERMAEAELRGVGDYDSSVVEGIAEVIVSTATGTEDHEEREIPTILAMASRGFVGIVQFGEV